MKQCSTCKIEKPFDEFHKNKTNPDGCVYSCKQCRSEGRKELSYEVTVAEHQCSVCKKVLPVSEFHRDKSNTFGLQSCCKECGREKTKRWATSFEGFFQKTFSSIKRNAVERKIQVDITIDDIKYLWNIQNGGCALTGKKMTMEAYSKRGKNQNIINQCNMSVDRIDSDKHYTKDNIQLVCAMANRMKMDLANEDFIQWSREVVAHADAVHFKNKITDM
jgi:hypothetical protein